MVSFILLLLLLVDQGFSETYCYDDCSNHGTCVNYICVCNPGWFGENCATSFGQLAPLSVGTKNLTSITQVNEVSKRNEIFFVGFSSSLCTRCAKEEDEYTLVDFHGIPFYRVDVIKHKQVLPSLTSLDEVDIPSIAFYWNYGKQRSMFKGPQTHTVLSPFALQKSTLKNNVEAYPFQNEPPPTLKDVITIIGFFRKEDSFEFDEFISEVAPQFTARPDLRFYYVSNLPNKKRTTRGLSWHPPLSTSLPALGLFSSSTTEFVTLSESETNAAKWITLYSAADHQAAKLTFESFHLAEETGLPMLLVFSPSLETLKPVLEELDAVAKEMKHKISVLYDDNWTFKDKMRVLGLVPKLGQVAMAINTKNSPPFPFRGDKVTKESIRVFCIDFLAGRVKPLSASETTTTSSQHNNEEEQDVPGVSESMKSSDVGIVNVTRADWWGGVALEDSVDVVVLVYRSKACPACKSVAPYFKKMARRFDALKATTSHRVKCGALDLDFFRPPSFVDVVVPAIVLLPAGNKSPPHLFFSAVMKVFPMMEWVRTNAGRKFDWGEELPQFDELEKKLFKKQIKEREERRKSEL
jgi:hypothetical protein